MILIVIVRILIMSRQKNPNKVVAVSICLEPSQLQYLQLDAMMKNTTISKIIKNLVSIYMEVE